MQSTTLAADLIGVCWHSTAEETFQFSSRQFICIDKHSPRTRGPSPSAQKRIYFASMRHLSARATLNRLLITFTFMLCSVLGAALISAQSKLGVEGESGSGSGNRNRNQYGNRQIHTEISVIAPYIHRYVS